MSENSCPLLGKGNFLTAHNLKNWCVWSKNQSSSQRCATERGGGEENDLFAVFGGVMHSKSYVYLQS